MSKEVANPTRLSRLPESEDTLGVGRMFRAAHELPDEDLATLRWRVRRSQRLRALRPRLFLKIALVTGLVFSMGAVMGAVFSPLRARKEASPAPGAATSPKPRKPRPVASPTVTPAPAEPVSDQAGSVAPEPEPVADQAPDQAKRVPAPGKRRAPVRLAMAAKATAPGLPGPPANVPAPVPASAIAVEQALLGQAMKTLRDGRDARGALALLGQYTARFPAGVLTSEATMLRVEALLALARLDEALAVLDWMPLASLPNRDEPLVVRGELRAGRGRWDEAKQDFDGVLGERSLPAASAKARNLQERALWGRAAARSRLGDPRGARADLELCLHHFPAGRFAGAAATLLQQDPSKGLP